MSSAQGVNGLKANVKAVQGELYFLEKGLIFIAKQPILIDFSKTESISFSRYVCVNSCRSQSDADEVVLAGE